MGHTPLPPVPRWKVITIAVGVLLLTAAVVIVLWWPATAGLTGAQLVTARLDALKVGLSIGVGGGGVFALYLAWRRQRSTEADLDNRERALAHQLQVAASDEEDALARRITDLYGKAVDQLGSEKAPVRLGGLYALERLAQDNANPRLRQTVVNMLCAYLRMPFAEAESDEARQEREVRLTAQRILTAHLEPGSDTFWADMDLDLTGATLINADFNRCRMGRATFEGTTFVGHAEFGDDFRCEDVHFTRATFSKAAYFKQAKFTKNAYFEDVTFRGLAWFGGAEFAERAWFNRASFHMNAWFSGASLGSSAWFPKCEFHGDAEFFKAVFGQSTNFEETSFIGGATFEGASFATKPFPLGAWVRVDVDPQTTRAWPDGWRLSSGEPQSRDGFPGLWSQFE